ncbi:hypothetical protein [Edaphobacter acidisoli]|nr:hypothetical protein [Edaphobacter acidisoli]
MCSLPCVALAATVETQTGPHRSETPATTTTSSPVQNNPFTGALSTLEMRAQATVPDPTTPPSREFHDEHYGVSFTVPVAWELTRKDSSVSTFNLDARSALRSTRMRAVATIDFNPHPTSTFSGALFYFSVTPDISAAQCSTQATKLSPRRNGTATIDGVTFEHGYDQHGVICTEARDEIFTAMRGNACYRFDMVINTYCGGDVSGVRDITPDELNSVRNRMKAILDSVRFDADRASR